MDDPIYDPEHPDFDHALAQRMAGMSIETAEYFNGLAESGWDKAEREELPAPPAWAMLPEDAQEFPVGALVEFTEETELMGGHVFAVGEHARVVEHRLTPIGAVGVQVRGSERRKMLTMMRDVPFKLAGDSG
jgi:hypothetical protein